MEPAGHVVWRARTCCKGALPRPVSGTPAARAPSACPRLCVSTVTPPISRRLPTVTPPISRRLRTVTSPISHRLPTVTSLFSRRLPTVTSPISRRLPTVTSLFSHRLPSVTSLFSHRLPTVTSLFSHRLPTVTSLFSHRLPSVTSLCSRPLPVFSAQRASMSLCSSAVPHPGSAFLCTGACYPLRHFCASTGSTVCWSCRSVVGSSELFCPSCSSIQPPNESKDFFQLLDCERSFSIDVQNLQRKYRNLQRLLHPDYFSQKSQRERDISEKQSSLVNKAYNTLLSPLSRGIYLLSLHDVTITDGTEGGVGSTFLFEILEINEKLDMSTEAEIEEIGTFLQDKCQSLTENVRGAFEKGDLESAKMLLTKMKYYLNILDQVKKKLVP